MLDRNLFICHACGATLFCSCKKVPKKHAKGEGSRRLPTALRYVRLTANIRSVSSPLLSNTDPLRWARRWGYLAAPSLRILPNLYLLRLHLLISTVVIGTRAKARICLCLFDRLRLLRWWTWDIVTYGGSCCT